MGLLLGKHAVATYYYSTNIINFHCSRARLYLARLALFADVDFCLFGWRWLFHMIGAMALWLSTARFQCMQH